MKKAISFLLAVAIVFSTYTTAPIANAEDDFEADYNFYVTLGTLPTLYAGLVAFGDDTESYMWFERKETFDTDKLPDHINLIAQDKGYGEEVIDQFAAKVLELYNLNPNAKFQLFTDDLRVHFILLFFVANNIPESNYKVYLLSDGTATYTYFNQNFKAENSYDNWENFANDFEDKWSKVSNGENVVSKTNTTVMRNTMYYASQKSNVQYWMQFPELLNSEDPQIIAELNKMNTVKIAPYTLYNDLTEETKQEFLEAVGIDKGFFDGLFNASPKPNLIISGTSLSGEQNGFEKVIEQIVADFGDEYDLFFKPHPAWNPETRNELKEINRKEFLDSFDIVLLPAQLPMETLLWAYSDLKIGGYSSSLYMSTAKEQTIFFIADSKQSLTAPLPELYDNGHFGAAKFYPINPKDDTPEPTPTPTPTEPNQPIVIPGPSEGNTAPTPTPTPSSSPEPKEEFDDCAVKTCESIIANDQSVQVTFDNVVTVSIPEGASENDFKLSVQKLQDLLGLVENEDELLSPVYELLKDFSGNFNSPITITFKIDVNKLNDNQYASIFYYDETDQKWIEIGGIVDEDRISAEVDHFTKFAVFAVDKTQPIKDAFTDVQTHWAKELITQAVSKGIVQGYDDNTFKPDRAISRSEFIVMLTRALKLEGNGTDYTFADAVLIEPWAADAVAIASTLGISEGYEDGTFRPQEKITRAEMVTMVGRALKQSVQDEFVTDFADDSEIPLWAKPYVAVAVANGYIEGRSNNYFVPDDQATRAEVVTLLMRVLEQ